MSGCLMLSAEGVGEVVGEELPLFNNPTAEFQVGNLIVLYPVAACS